MAECHTIHISIQKAELYRKWSKKYINTLENVDKTHPGCKDMVKEKGMSVQGQNKYPCRIAADQRGELIINQDAKVAREIKTLC